MEIVDTNLDYKKHILDDNRSVIGFITIDYKGIVRFKATDTSYSSNNLEELAKIIRDLETEELDTLSVYTCGCHVSTTNPKEKCPTHNHPIY